jgi:hypothetical protein
MPITQTLPNRKEVDLVSPFVSTLIIVFFLFFIDEGYYDFRWMKEWGNWLVFVIYMIIFFPLQWLISYFVFYKLSGWKKAAAMVGLTVPATILLLWLVF